MPALWTILCVCVRFAGGRAKDTYACECNLSQTTATFGGCDEDRRESITRAWKHYFSRVVATILVLSVRTFDFCCLGVLVSAGERVTCGKKKD
jgi:hypothetical protein